MCPVYAHHAGLHLAHGMEVKLLLTVVETLYDPVTLRLVLQHGESSQVAAKVLAETLITSCIGTHT